jgi:hypothetical protein
MLWTAKSEIETAIDSERRMRDAVSFFFFCVCHVSSGFIVLVLCKCFVIGCTGVVFVFYPAAYMPLRCCPCLLMCVHINISF